VQRSFYLIFAAAVLSLFSCFKGGAAETAKRDMTRDARSKCDRGDGAACFHAGSLTADEPGGASKADPLFARGCALKNPASCDAVWASKGPGKTDALAGGCNAGDLLSCARVAEMFASDPAKAADAKSLREQTCRMGATVTVHMGARDLYAAAEGCSGLARMHSKGEGGKVDTVLATKLDILATTLRTEALSRMGRIHGSEKPQPDAKGVITEGEKDRVERANRATTTMREQLLASIDSAAKAAASEGAPPAAPPATPTEPIFWPTAGASMAAGSPQARCQKCVEGCGDIKVCAGTDDFSGGRCGYLRGTDKFDNCVAECTAKADVCAKACTDCTGAPPPAAPAAPAAPAGGGDTAPPAVAVANDDAARCKETGDRISCAVAGAAAEKTEPNVAYDLYLSGCAKKSESCVNVVIYADSLFKRREGPRAVQVLDKGCELKSPLACTRLAFELEEGEHGVPQDLAKAAKLYDKACDMGVVRACVGLAAMIEDGRGTPRNDKRLKIVRGKIEALDKAPLRPAPLAAQMQADEDACRKSKDAARCISAGTAMQDVDAVKAEELYRIGCTANKNVCGLWSFAIDRFRKDDNSRGTRILDQGCQEGHAMACLVFADVSRFGYRGVAKSDGRVLELWNKACELGEAAGCRGAASRIRNGLGGVAKSPPRADELREKAFKADEEAEKARRADYDKWIERAGAERLREPYARELDRRRTELATMVDKTRARTKDSSTEKAAPQQEEVDASQLRQAAIVRMAKALFLSK